MSCRIAFFLHRKLRALAERRDPDIVIRDKYMRRWYLIPRNPFFNIYYHEFAAPDEPVLHDHPWLNLSFILDGAYVEHVPASSTKEALKYPAVAAHPSGQRSLIRMAGDLVLRRPTSLHYIEPITRTVATLFITGPRIREWGFLCWKGWVHHRDYVDARDSGKTGLGCDAGATETRLANGSILGFFHRGSPIASAARSFAGGANE